MSDFYIPFIDFYSHALLVYLIVYEFVTIGRKKLAFIVSIYKYAKESSMI